MSALAFIGLVAISSATGVASALIAQAIADRITRRRIARADLSALLTVYDRGVVRPLDVSQITAEPIDAGAIGASVEPGLIQVDPSRVRWD